ncbi:HzsA-related protein [Piscinibacter terrae]|uniref:Hydrazine synthase alpha subunit middle domain-containing protein n=1 Tax=Piscinibacter terrae TaxID=2496871 RepID=A0A3N7HWG0_9BURK|nr:hypothetical protein [Albitalea terrae]RQP25351.1 hypothetical protein DZC73_11040 [Albitalea terrae]
MKYLGGMGALALATATTTVGLVACGSGSGTDSATVTVQGDVPIAYVMRANTISMNPTNGAPSAPGGDLFIREKSSPSAPEHNITAQFTQGKGDASDPEVSYDGKKIIFSMKCPASNTSTIDGGPACTGAWNIWEYDMTKGGLTAGTFKRLTSSSGDDDVDPVYLPGGRGVVFSSNRQTKSHVNQALGHSYYALDEYERERVFNLHMMDVDGKNITQTSFNQSHDRNPVVRPNGDIMFSRWDHVGGRNHFKVFRAKPDGTDMFVLYGAHSEGNSFLHPRDMDPKGKYAGFLSSDLMPLSRTHEGGGLVFIDAANYSEQNTPVNPKVASVGGQKQMTENALNLGGGISKYGRITTPYPLWDGTDRVLLAYKPCAVTKDGVETLCANLPQADLDRLADDMRLNTEIEADSVKDNVRPNYAIYMFDPATQQMRVVATPPAGFMYTDPVAIQERPEPNQVDPTNVDPTLAAANMGLLEVRSVYDTDGLGRMGDNVITAADLPAGCTTAIAKTTPTDPEDTRSQVADISKIKDPAQAAYGCAPARFIRVVRAVAPVQSSMGLRSAIGETDFEMQQILGYAPIEPDGSFKLQVPADTPIALAVVDSKGRAFQTHTNWIQVRPGERRTCDGCHSPRRGGALNSGNVANSIPAGAVDSLSTAHMAGETQAGTRTRLNPALLTLSQDMVYDDVWADTTKGGVKRASIEMRYTGNSTGDKLNTTIPTNGVINYPDHIAPLWTVARGVGGADTCTNCHSDPLKLNLASTITGTGRMASYERLMVGDPVIDPVTGLPQTRIEEGVPVIVRQPAMVSTMASEGDADGLSRQSRLVEILWGENLKAGADTRTLHPNPPNTAPDHSKLLNLAEKRLVAEWIDLGGKYYNDPFNSGSGVRTINTLSQTTFESQVYPIILANCATTCHQAIGSNGQSTGTTFRQNRYVLTGDVEGDFNVTLTMISDVCSPASSYLLKKPSTVPHPAGATGQTAAVLPVGSANYNTILNWIQSGCH